MTADPAASLAAHIDALERQMVNAVLLLPPQFGPKPNLCAACGRTWRGLEEGLRAVCCGAGRSDLLRLVAADYDDA